MKNNNDMKANDIYDINNMNCEINIHDFKVHPIYTKYGANKEGNIIDLSKNKYVPIYDDGCGYKCFIIYFNSKQKNYKAHRFIWECFNGIISDDIVMDHINNNKTDNKLENLQSITQSQNIKKSVVRDKKFNQNIRKNNKFIKSICTDNGDIDYYHSTYLA